MPQYGVLVYNNDVGEGETNPPIQFWANSNWVNIPSGKRVIISETAMENLKNCVQMRPVPGTYELDKPPKKVPYTRFPMTILRVIYSEKEKHDGLPEKNKERDAELLDIKAEEVEERTA